MRIVKLGDQIIVKRNDLIYSTCEVIGVSNGGKERKDQIFVKDLSSFECKWVRLDDCLDNSK